MEARASQPQPPHLAVNSMAVLLLKMRCLFRRERKSTTRSPLINSIHGSQVLAIRLPPVPHVGFTRVWIVRSSRVPFLVTVGRVQAPSSQSQELPVSNHHRGDPKVEEQVDHRMECKLECRVDRKADRRVDPPLLCSINQRSATSRVVVNLVALSPLMRRNMSPVLRLSTLLIRALITKLLHLTTWQTEMNSRELTTYKSVTHLRAVSTVLQTHQYPRPSQL